MSEPRVHGIESITFIRLSNTHVLSTHVDNFFIFFCSLGDTIREFFLLFKVSTGRKTRPIELYRLFEHSSVCIWCYCKFKVLNYS